MHRTGFRAEHACVTALALPDRAGYEQREALARAAERYGVPLVAADRLSDEALRHGAPLPDDFVDARARVAAAPRRRRGRRADRAADPERSTRPRSGPPRAASRWTRTCGSRPRWAPSSSASRARWRAASVGEPALTLPQPGASLEAGDLVATLRSPSGTFGVWAPVGGSVLAVNPRLAADPGLLARDPEGAGWLLRLAPRDWDARGVAP